MKIVSDTGNGIYCMGNYKKTFTNNVNFFKNLILCWNYISTGPWEML